MGRLEPYIIQGGRTRVGRTRVINTYKDNPKQGHDSNAAKDLHEDGERVLGTKEARLEQRKPYSYENVCVCGKLNIVEIREHVNHWWARVVRTRTVLNSVRCTSSYARIQNIVRIENNDADYFSQEYGNVEVKHLLLHAPSSSRLQLIEKGKGGC